MRPNEAQERQVRERLELEQRPSDPPRFLQRLLEVALGFL